MSEKDIKILVAYDGSSYSVKALDVAAKLASKLNASITLFYVEPQTGRGSQPVPTIGTASPSSLEQAYSAVEGTGIGDRPAIYKLSDAESKLKKMSVNYDMETRRGSDPASEILKMAKEGKYDFIALGSRGFGEVRALVLGSVSHRVASEAEATVLIAK